MLKDLLDAQIECIELLTQVAKQYGISLRLPAGALTEPDKRQFGYSKKQIPDNRGGGDE